MRLGDGAGGLSADSPFSDLAAAWLEAMRRDHDLADNTKETYERELRTLVMPTFENFTVREVTVGRVESFLKAQRAKSYPRAKHSRTILGMVMSFAVRREIVPRNPVKETSRLKKPKHVPKALTAEQIAQIREAAEHRRDSRLPGHRFETMDRTDSRFEQKGLEQRLYDDNPQAAWRIDGSGGFNKLRPISPLNPMRDFYMDAAEQFLERCDG